MNGAQRLWVITAARLVDEAIVPTGSSALSGAASGTRRHEAQAFRILTVVVTITIVVLVAGTELTIVAVVLVRHAVL